MMHHSHHKIKCVSASVPFLSSLVIVGFVFQLFQNVGRDVVEFGFGINGQQYKLSSHITRKVNHSHPAAFASTRRDHLTFRQSPEP